MPVQAGKRDGKSTDNHVYRETSHSHSERRLAEAEEAARILHNGTWTAKIHGRTLGGMRTLRYGDGDCSADRCAVRRHANIEEPKDLFLLR